MGASRVRFALLDAVKQTQLASMAYTVTPAQFRATAHKIADLIYEKLTGDAGVFSTRIAYITKQGSRFELIVADADGGNPQAVVASNEPLLSPAWSPDGSRLAYVSFENKKPVVYVQSLTSGARQVVANFRGSNSAPAWAPDGRRARRDPHQGRRVAALHDQRRRQRRHAPAQLDRESIPRPRSRPTAARSCSAPIAAARRKSTGSRCAGGKSSG
jgi:dipeptidyl aminopeptidase/acylaminoacyl peptidase